MASCCPADEPRDGGSVRAGDVTEVPVGYEIPNKQQGVPEGAPHLGAAGQVLMVFWAALRS